MPSNGWVSAASRKLCSASRPPPATHTSCPSSCVVPQLERVSIRTELIGVKDVVLLGEMKTLLNRVIEAEKEAAANVILRREEVAATRSLANTARLMAEQPVLLRLEELDAMKEIAANINEVRVVVGARIVASCAASEREAAVSRATLSHRLRGGRGREGCPPLAFHDTATTKLTLRITACKEAQTSNPPCEAIGCFGLGSRGAARARLPLRKTRRDAGQ